MLTFNSIDVEIANAGGASICQTGIVHTQGDKIEDQWKALETIMHQAKHT